MTAVLVGETGLMEQGVGIAETAATVIVIVVMDAGMDVVIRVTDVWTVVAAIVVAATVVVQTAEGVTVLFYETRVNNFLSPSREKSCLQGM